MSMFEEAPTSQATPACRPRRMDLVGKACLAAAWNGAHPGGRPESDHPCGCHGRPNIPSPSQGVGRGGDAAPQLSDTGGFGAPRPGSPLPYDAYRA